jgi:hypothetical protein
VVKKLRHNIRSWDAKLHRLLSCDYCENISFKRVRHLENAPEYTRNSTGAAQNYLDSCHMTKLVLQ